MLRADKIIGLCLLLLILAVAGKTAHAVDGDANYFGFGLGIKKGFTENVDLKAASNTGYERRFQYLDVESRHCIGWHLTATVDDKDLQDKNQDGASGQNTYADQIKMINKNGALTDNTWGMGVLDDNNKAPKVDGANWLGVSDENKPIKLYSQKNLTYDQANPVSCGNTTSEAVYYGVKMNSAKAGVYTAAKITYTLTPDIDNMHPYPISVNPSRQDIDSDPQRVTIKGNAYTNGEVTAGIDFDKDGKIDDNEKCTDAQVTDDYTLTCQLPKLPDTDANGGEFSVLLRYDDEEHTSYPDNSVAVTYYHQPTIKSISDTILTKKKKAVARDIVSDDGMTTVLTDDSAVYQWGSGLMNCSNNLYPATEDCPDGLDSVTTTVTSPRQVNKFPKLSENGDYITSLAGGGQSTFAVTKDGAIYGWGNNQVVRSDGGRRLSLESVNSNWEPNPSYVKSYDRADLSDKALQMSVGNGFFVAINSKNSSNASSDKIRTKVWGLDNHSQYGDKDDKDSTSLKRQIYTNENGHKENSWDKDTVLSKVSAGSGHVILMDSNGRVSTWGQRGDQNSSRLGFKANRDAGHPHDIGDKLSENNGLYGFYDDGKYAIDIAAGENFSMVLDNIHHLWTFGANDMGQLGHTGDGSYKAEDITTNFKLTTGENIIGITAHDKTAAAWTNKGRIFAWGQNSGTWQPSDNQQTISSSVPIKVSDYNDVVKVILGDVNYAINGDGEIIGWNNHMGSYSSSTGYGTNFNLNDEIENPVYYLHLTGTNLAQDDTASMIWLDRNSNGVRDSGEDLSRGNTCTQINCYVAVDTHELNDGEYNLHVRTQYDGDTSIPITIVTKDYHNQNIKTWTTINNPTQKKTNKLAAKAATVRKLAKSSQKLEPETSTGQQPMTEQTNPKENREEKSDEPIEPDNEDDDYSAEIVLADGLLLAKTPDGIYNLGADSRFKDRNFVELKSALGQKDAWQLMTKSGESYQIKGLLQADKSTVANSTDKNKEGTKSDQPASEAKNASLIVVKDEAKTSLVTSSSASKLNEETTLDKSLICKGDNGLDQLQLDNTKFMVDDIKQTLVDQPDLLKNLRACTARGALEKYLTDHFEITIQKQMPKTPSASNLTASRNDTANKTSATLTQNQPAYQPPGDKSPQ